MGWRLCQPGHLLPLRCNVQGQQTLVCLEEQYLDNADIETSGVPAECVIFLVTLFYHLVIFKFLSMNFMIFLQTLPANMKADL